MCKSCTTKSHCQPTYRLQIVDYWPHFCFSASVLAVSTRFTNLHSAVPDYLRKAGKTGVNMNIFLASSGTCNSLAIPICESVVEIFAQKYSMGYV